MWRRFVYMFYRESFCARGLVLDRGVASLSRHDSGDEIPSPLCDSFI